MLNPFTGGDGPLGFYVSFLFIALSFIVSLSLGIIAFFKKDFRKGVAIVLIMIGITYNAVFVEELLFGRINGNAPVVMNSALKFIEESENIKNVITYNDIGGYELNKMQKYEGRFYAVPAYEEVHKKLFKSFNGHYLVVDMPHLYDGFYREFFSTCKAMFEARSINIETYVYDCKDSTYLKDQEKNDAKLDKK
jgi:hypothetical protein